MINLLPPQGKKTVRREYRIRVASAYLVLMGTAVLIVGVLFFPSFFLIIFQKSAYISQLDSSVDISKLEGIEEEFAAANNISDLLLDTKHYLPAGAVIDVVWELATEEIAINDMQVTKDKGVISAVNVKGVAANREVLISFRDNLKGHEYFESVNLPISDLTQSENINFTISMTPAEVLSKPIVYED